MSTLTMTMARCHNPNCRDAVPDGWPGGYCGRCWDAIEAEDIRTRSAIEAAAIPPRSRVSASEAAAPYARYGFGRGREQ